MHVRMRAALIDQAWVLFFATLLGAGGEKVCAVGGPDPRPEDLLCGECTALTSPARSQETCTVHGTDHIVWKCHFCCGVAVSGTSGTTSGVCWSQGGPGRGGNTAKAGPACSSDHFLKYTAHHDGRLGSAEHKALGTADAALVTDAPSRLHRDGCAILCNLKWRRGLGPSALTPAPDAPLAPNPPHPSS
jgi:hypothetical protein